MVFAAEKKHTSVPAKAVYEILEKNPIEPIPVFMKNYYRMKDLLAPDLLETGYIGAPAKDLPDLFQKAHRHIESIWQREVRPFVDELCREWNREISDTQTDIKETLKDTANVDRMIHIHQMGALEHLRHIKPDAWYTLLLASSLAQRASISAVRKMIDTFQADDFRTLCLSRDELRVYLEIAGTTAEAFDLLYLKQIILTDNQDEFHLIAAEGNDRAYEWIDTKKGESHILPFFEVFREDTTNISHTLHRKADEIEAGYVNAKYYTSESALHKLYVFSFSKLNGLPTFLRRFGELLTSDETDAEFVSDQWNMMMSLVKRMALVDHCPILLFPPLMASVDGDATVDLGYRLGLRTRQMEEQEHMFDPYRTYAQEIINANSDALSQDSAYEVPPILVSYQFFATGSDLWWRTQGDSHEDLLMIHPDAIADAAREFYIPLARKFLHTQELTDDQIIAIITEINGIHEIAHTIMTTYDGEVAKRIGDADESCILEELKANSLTMKLLKKRMESEFGSLENTPDAILRAYINVYLSQLLYFQLYKSSERASGGQRYFYPSLLILNEILEASEKDPILKLEDGKLHIEDSIGFINRVDEIADIVMVAYTDTQSPAEQIQSDIRKFTEDVYALKGNSKAETLRRLYLLKSMHPHSIPLPFTFN